MNEVIIFCESYPQIKNALYLAERNYENQPVTIVIPGMNDLYKFFKLVNERVFQGTLNVICFDIYRGRIAKAGNRIIKGIYLLPEILRERRHLSSIFSQHFARLRRAEVFFCSRCSNPSTFYLLKRLDKTNRLVYMPDPTFDALSIDEVTPGNIAELVYLTMCKLVYGYEMALSRHPLGQTITRMTDEFFRRRVSRVITREERDSLLKDFNTGQFNLVDDSDCSILYLHEDLVGFNYVADPAAFVRRLTEVFRIIGKYFPENKVAIKYHPGYGEIKAAPPFGRRLPDFIPAELFYNEKIKMYLSTTSMALANVEKGAAVSLIDLIDFRDDIIKAQLKKALIQWSRSEIRFPQSLDEFERILLDIKNSA